MAYGMALETLQKYILPNPQNMAGIRKKASEIVHLIHKNERHPYEILGQLDYTIMQWCNAIYRHITVIKCPIFIYYMSSAELKPRHKPNINTRVGYFL